MIGNEQKLLNYLISQGFNDFTINYEEAQRSLQIPVKEIITILERFSSSLMGLIEFTNFELSPHPHGYVSLNKNRIRAYMS